MEANPIAIQDTKPIIPLGHPSRYTGETLLRTRPRTYYKVVNMLAAGEPVTTIMRLCRVAQQTVEAISSRRAEDISERKKGILANMCDLAQLSSERAVSTVGKASFRDAVIGAGVSVDKILAITGQTPVAQVAIVNMPSESERAERRAMHDKLDAIAKRLALPE
jgi:hypothetical protein